MRKDSAPILSSPIPPALVRHRVIKVLRPTGSNEVKGICINQELAAVLTHWDDLAEGKVRCHGNQCQRCGQQGIAPSRWYGYMPVLSLATGRVACLEITVQAARDCPQLSSKRIPLRGKMMSLRRYGRGKYGRVQCTVDEWRKDQPLPPAEDMGELLDMLFEACEKVPYFGRRETGERKFHNGI